MVQKLNLEVEDGALETVLTEAKKVVKKIFKKVVDKVKTVC